MPPKRRRWAESSVTVAPGKRSASLARTCRRTVASRVRALPAALFAAEPPAGTYKVVLPLGSIRALWLLKIESADGKWTGTATPAPKVPAAKVEEFKIDKGLLQFSLNLKEEGTF